MRLKLVLLASLAASILGAGSSIAIILGLSSFKIFAESGSLLVLIVLLPVALVLLAAYFVYRHTARRRKTQALMTAVLAMLLDVAAFVLAAILTAHTKPIELPPPPRPSVDHSRIGRQRAET